MGWRADVVPDLVGHIAFEHTEAGTFAEFRWQRGVIESGFPIQDDPGGLVFAENIAAELKEQRGRWGVPLPWEDEASG